MGLGPVVARARMTVFYDLLHSDQRWAPSTLLNIWGSPYLFVLKTVKPTEKSKEQCSSCSRPFTQMPQLTLDTVPFSSCTCVCAHAAASLLSFSFFSLFFSRTRDKLHHNLYLLKTGHSPR